MRRATAIPTFAWRNVGSVIGGKLYQVPTSRPIVSNLMLKNSMVWDQEIGANYVPKNATEFEDFWGAQLSYAVNNNLAINAGGGKHKTFFGQVTYKIGKRSGTAAAVQQK